MAEAPYPSDTRAKGWRFELDHERIRQSDTWALCPAEHRPWLLMLWMVAWEQTPCGSMPEDDSLICARIGMTPKAFSKAKASLMRGWWKADDGRLYHKVITERVLEMMEWRRKEADRKRGSRGKAHPDHESPAPVPRDTTVTDDTGTITSTYSVPKGTGGAPPTDRETVFAQGVPLLTAAGVSEKNARSMLAGLCKKHTEANVVQAIAKTASDHPGEPVSWLQALLNGPQKAASQPRHYDDAEKTARMLAEQSKNTTGMPAVVREFAAQITGRKAA